MKTSCGRISSHALARLPVLRHFSVTPLSDCTFTEGAIPGGSLSDPRHAIPNSKWRCLNQWGPKAYALEWTRFSDAAERIPAWYWKQQHGRVIGILPLLAGGAGNLQHRQIWFAALISFTEPPRYASRFLLQTTRYPLRTFLLQ